VRGSVTLGSAARGAGRAKGNKAPHQVWPVGMAAGHLPGAGRIMASLHWRQKTARDPRSVAHAQTHARRSGRAGTLGSAGRSPKQDCRRRMAQRKFQGKKETLCCVRIELAGAAAGGAAARAAAKAAYKRRVDGHGRDLAAEWTTGRVDGSTTRPSGSTSRASRSSSQRTTTTRGFTPCAPAPPLVPRYVCVYRYIPRAVTVWDARRPAGASAPRGRGARCADKSAAASGGRGRGGGSRGSRGRGKSAVSGGRGRGRGRGGDGGGSGGRLRGELGSG
jgi:hypothetical protein